jgi:4-amino-4-deoxy-L-arabinose transferase-like glycosyltransferase
VLAFSLGLRLLFFVGYANVDPWDDTLYLALAETAVLDDDSPTRALAEVSSFAARRGTYLLVAAAQSAFGKNEVAAAIPALLASLGLGMVAFRFATLCGAASAAWLAPLLLAGFPLEIAYASRITADVPTAFWMSASLLLLLEARRVTTADGASRTTALLVFLGGFALYAGCFTRLSALIAVPPLIATVLLCFRGAERLRVAALFAVGFFLPALTDGLLQLARHGSLFHFLSIERGLQRAVFSTLPQAVVSPVPFLSVHVSYTEGVVHQLVKESLRIVELYPGVHYLSGYGLMGVAAIAFSVLGRNSNPVVKVLGLWSLFVFLYVQYGFRGLSWEEGALHYYLVAPRPRHLLPMGPALAAVLALAYQRFHLRWRLSSTVVASALFVSGLAAAWQNHRFLRESMADVRAAAAHIERQREDVYVDSWAYRQLPLYVSDNARQRLRLLSEHRVEVPDGALLLIGGSRGFDVDPAVVASGLSSPLSALHLEDSKSAPRLREVFRRDASINAARASPIRIYLAGS